MNRAETAIIMGILKVAYPQYYKNISPEEANNAISIWHEMFAEDDLNIVKAAVKALILTDAKGFPPVIGQVKEKIYQLTKDNDMTEEEAWKIVRNACSYYEAADNFERLPEILKKLVGSPNQLREWAQIELKTLESVIKSNFIRSYRAKMINHKNYNMFTSDIKALSDHIKKVDGLCEYNDIKSIESSEN